ncbi:MAG: hypothetical protein L0K56_05015, partial [Corynebacterium sp.]|nr:hypothetical protein [Corynebacterium sp.]
DPSPLRLLAQWTPDLGGASPLTWRDRASRALRLRRGAAYHVDVRDLTGERARFAEARRLLTGYLGEEHTSYATRREPGTDATFVDNMADWLRRIHDGEIHDGRIHGRRTPATSVRPRTV